MITFFEEFDEPYRTKLEEVTEPLVTKAAPKIKKLEKYYKEENEEEFLRTIYAPKIGNSNWDYIMESSALLGKYDILKKMNFYYYSDEYDAYKSSIRLNEFKLELEEIFNKNRKENKGSESTSEYSFIDLLFRAQDYDLIDDPEMFQTIYYDKKHRVHYPTRSKDEAEHIIGMAYDFLWIDRPDHAKKHIDLLMKFFSKEEDTVWESLLEDKESHSTLRATTLTLWHWYQAKVTDIESEKREQAQKAIYYQFTNRMNCRSQSSDDFLADLVFTGMSIAAEFDLNPEWIKKAFGCIQNVLVIENRAAFNQARKYDIWNTPPEVMGWPPPEEAVQKMIEVERELRLEKIRAKRRRKKQMANKNKP